MQELLRWGWVAGSSAGVMWDYDSWDALTARQERLARELGALTILPFTLSIRAGMYLYAGKCAEATFLVDQAQDVTAASENLRFRNASLLVAVFRGDEQETRKLIDAITKDSTERGEGAAFVRGLVGDGSPLQRPRSVRGRVLRCDRRTQRPQ